MTSEKEHDAAAAAVANYPASEIRGEVTIRYRFWAGSAEETIEQNFRGTMRQVKDYAEGFTDAIKNAPDWGGGR